MKLIIQIFSVNTLRKRYLRTNCLKMLF